MPARQFQPGENFLGGTLEIYPLLEREQAHVALNGLHEAARMLEERLEADERDGKYTIEAAPGYEFVVTVKPLRHPEHYMPIATGQYVGPTLEYGGQPHNLKSLHYTSPEDAPPFAARRLIGTTFGIVAVDDQHIGRVLRVKPGRGLAPASPLDEVTHQPVQPTPPAG